MLERGWIQLPLAGLTLAFLFCLSAFSSGRVMAICCLPCSLPLDFLAFDFLPLESVQEEDLAEQQLLPASALPLQQEDLLLVHSVLALSPEQEELWADAVAPNRKSAPRRKMCFMSSFVCNKGTNCLFNASWTPLFCK